MIYLPNYTEIIPHLYIGNAASLSDVYLFDLVINCTTDLPFPSDRIRKLYKQTYIRFSVDENNQHILDTIHNVISQNKNVLLYCNTGQHQSCILGAYYILHTNGQMQYNDIITFITKKRLTHIQVQ